MNHPQAERGLHASVAAHILDTALQHLSILHETLHYRHHTGTMKNNHVEGTH